MQPMLDTSNLPRIPAWKSAATFTDILYEKAEGIAKCAWHLTMHETTPQSVLSF